jgi:hypothetical protein
VKQLVRDFARPLVADPPVCIDEVVDRWRAALPPAAPP